MCKKNNELYGMSEKLVVNPNY